MDALAATAPATIAPDEVAASPADTTALLPYQPLSKAAPIAVGAIVT